MEFTRFSTTPPFRRSFFEGIGMKWIIDAAEVALGIAAAILAIYLELKKNNRKLALGAFGIAVLVFLLLFIFNPPAPEQPRVGKDTAYYPPGPAPSPPPGGKTPPQPTPMPREELAITEPSDGDHNVSQQPPITFVYRSVPADQHLWLIVIGNEDLPTSDPNLYWPIGYIDNLLGEGRSAILYEEITRNDPKPHTWESKVGDRHAWFSNKGMKYRLELIALDEAGNRELGKAYKANAGAGFPGVKRKQQPLPVNSPVYNYNSHIIKKAPKSVVRVTISITAPSPLSVLSGAGEDHGEFVPKGGRPKATSTGRCLSS
jgi:hypothetical protein